VIFDFQAKFSAVGTRYLGAAHLGNQILDYFVSIKQVQYKQISVGQGVELAKSSHLLNKDLLTADSARQIIPETSADRISEHEADRTAEREADAAIAARAVVAVSLLGSGFWYLLWKLTFYLLAGH
jgi:hypothetical protein